MPINEETLLSFVGTNTSVLDEIIGSDANEIKSLLSTGAISGMKDSEILGQLSKVTTSKHATKAMLNTKLNTLSRVATNTMMKDAPADTKYVYVGPVDDRTRDECLDMAFAGALTEAQIINQFGAAPLVDGGGINCRHKWEIASEEGTRFHEGKQAQQVIKQKKELALAKQAKRKYKPKPKPYSKDALHQAGKHNTIADSKSWMKSNIADKVTLTKMKDLDLANELTDTLSNLFTTYKLKKLSYGVDGRAGKKAMASANGGTLSISSKALSRKSLDAYYDRNIGNFRTKRIETISKWKKELKRFEELKKQNVGNFSYEINWYKKNIKIYEKKIEAMEEYGFKRFVYATKGNEFTNIITHEFGHILHDQYTGFINGNLFKKAGLTAVRDANYWNDKWKNIYRITTAPKGRKVYLLDGTTTVGTAEVGLISEYAAKNPMELFAESFNMYATGAANELPAIIKEYLDEYLTEIKGLM